MNSSLFNTQILKPAVIDSFRKLDPRRQWENPVMFITELGAVITTMSLFSSRATWFEWQIALWLWFTVLFANFSEAIAEGRGKAQAESLKSSRTDIKANRLENGITTDVAANDLRKAKCVGCTAGDVIPLGGR